MAAKKTKPTLITDLRPAPKQSGWQKLQKFLAQNIRIVSLVAVVILAAVAVFLLLAHHGKSNSKAAGQKQIDQTVAKVSKLFLVPQGEQPTLAIINDATKYRNVAFFKSAQNGDQLLVYAQAREAILYRPSINKIVAVAPITPSAGTQSTPSQ